ncbi:CARDB domain-containing protein [Sorangium sp. So ce269]
MTASSAALVGAVLVSTGCGGEDDIQARWRREATSKDAAQLGAGAPAGDSASPSAPHPSFSRRAASEAGTALTTGALLSDGGGAELPSTYGQASAGSQEYEYIDEVRLTYSPDNKQLTLTVEVVIITGDPDDYGAGQFVNAWIDWDGSGQFDEYREKVMNQLLYEDTVNYQGSLVFQRQINVPEAFEVKALAEPFSPMLNEAGQVVFTLDVKERPTWLRINHGYGVNPGPTGSWPYGSVVNRAEVIPAPVVTGETADVEVEIRDFRTGATIHTVDFSGMPIGPGQRVETVWDGRSSGYMPYPNGSYPMKVTFVTDRMSGESHVHESAIPVFDDPDCMVEVKSRMTAYAGGWRATTRYWQMTDGEKPNPEDVVARGEDPESSVSVRGVVVDLLAGGLTTLVTTNIGGAIAGSVLAQAVNGFIDGMIEANNPARAETFVNMNGERKEWLPAVRDGGLIFYYDNLSDNVVLDTERVNTRTVMLPHPQMDLYHQIPSYTRGWQLKPYSTAPPSLGTFGFVNLDSIGNMPAGDPSWADYEGSIADIRPATIDLAAFKEYTLDRYKAEEVYFVRSTGAGEGCGAPGVVPVAAGAPSARIAAAAERQSTAAAASDGLAAAGIDDDGDGLYDWLEVSVPVEVTTPGDYLVHARLGNHDRTALVAEARGATVPLQAGQQTVTARFWGPAIRMSGHDGPYTLDGLSLALPPNVFINPEVGQTTAAFSHLAFAAPRIGFAGPAADRTVVAGNGQGYSALAVDVPVLVGVQGSYYLRSTLMDGAGRPLATSTKTRNLPAGAQSFTLEFPGERIRASGADGPYTIALLMAYPDIPEMLSSQHVTSAYDHDDFRPPAARLTGNLIQSSVDDDADGLFNHLEVTSEGSVQLAGTFRLQGTLTTRGGQLVGVATLEQAAAPGLNTWSLRFDGDRIAAAASPDLLLQTALFEVTAEGLRGVDSTGRVALTPIDPARFGPARHARLTGAVTDEALELTGDGRRDVLRFHVGVDAAVAGNYRLSGRLLGPGGADIAHVAQSVWLSAGAATLDLDVAGARINVSRLDGPYTLTDLSLHYTGVPSWPQVAHLQAAHTTGPYEHESFAPGAARLTGAGSDRGVDLDGDALFDQLEVLLTVEVSEPGSYRLDANLHDAGDVSIQRVQSQTLWLGAGTHPVALRFTGGRIRGHGDASPYRVRHARLIAGSVEVDRLDPAYTTGAYRGAQFEQMPADLSVALGGVTIQQLDQASGHVAIKAVVHNEGGEPAHGALVRVGAGGETFDETLAAVTGAAPAIVVVDWQPPAGSHTVAIDVDPEGAVSEVSEENNSTSFSVDVPLAFPTAPAGLSSTTNGAAVDLRWTPPDNLAVVGYHVYRAESASGPYEQRTLFPVQATAFTDAAAGRPYWYRVSSVAGSLPARESAPTAPIQAEGSDTVPPVTVAAVSGTPGLGGYHVSAAQLSLHATDDISGVARTELSLDGGATWEPYAGPRSLAQSRTYTVSYRSIDRSGNVEATRQQVVRVDVGNPVASLGAQRPPDNDGWYTGNIALAISGTDDHAGVRSVSYAVNGGSAIEVAGDRASLTLSGQGTHQLTFWTRDHAGNTGATSSATVKIWTSPIPALSFSPGTKGGFECIGTHHRGTLSWTSAGPGMTYRLYRASTLVYSGTSTSFTSCFNGTYRVRAVGSLGEGPSSNVVSIGTSDL